ncbi:hypothetical protein ACFSHP_01575 [Novosphingobium panipatense]
MFEPNAEWTDRAKLNMQSSLAELQQRLGNQVVEAPKLMVTMLSQSRST